MIPPERLSKSTVLDECWWEGVVKVGHYGPCCDINKELSIL